MQILIQHEAQRGTVLRRALWIAKYPLLLAAFIALGAGLTKADTFDIGVVSFDNLVPSGPGTSGVNVFTLFNFTGTNSGPPEVLSELDFLNTTVTLNGSTSVNEGTITPGSLQDAGLEFPTTEAFTEADFSATLSSLFFTVNGADFMASSNTVTGSLLPSSPPDLAAGTDFLVLSIEASPFTSPVPEPDTFAFMLCGLFILAIVTALSRRKWQQA